MDLFNQANLTHNGRLIPSNVVTGTVVSALSLGKASVSGAYRQGSRVCYQVWITNNSDTAYPQQSLLDNFGRYDWQNLSRFPLTYVNGSAKLYLIDALGVRSAPVTIAVSTAGITFRFAQPANSTAWLQYCADISPSAPLPVGSSITNVVTLSRPAPAPALTATQTIPVESYADVEIAKSACSAAAEGLPISYDLALSNYGNTATAAQDSLIVTDRLQPYLTQLTVTANGSPWTEGVQYTYDTSTGLFRTVLGAVQLPAADFEQKSFGTWEVTPSTLVLTLTGIPQAAPAPQAVVRVVSAYTDSSQLSTTVQRLQNDRFLLGSSGTVVPKYHISTDPNSGLALLPTSDPRFSLTGNILTLDTGASAQPAVAYVQVDYAGGGFVVQLDYA